MQTSTKERGGEGGGGGGERGNTVTSAYLSPEATSNHSHVRILCLWNDSLQSRLWYICAKQRDGHMNVERMTYTSCYLPAVN